MDARAFASLIRGALAPWDREPSADAMRAYHADLSSVPDELLTTAVAHLRRTRAREQAQPTSADFLAAVEAVSRERTRQPATLHRGADPTICPACSGTGFAIIPGSDGLDRARRCSHVSNPHRAL